MNNTSVRYNEVLGMVHQLSQTEINKLLRDLQLGTISRKQTDNIAGKPTKMQKLLLQAPTWSDEEYNAYLNARNDFNHRR